MSAGKIIGYVLAGLCMILGFLFVISISYNGFGFWAIMGILLIGFGAFIIYSIKMREPKPKQVIEQKIDLTGDVDAAKLKCKNCGADLDKDSIKVVEGAVMINCPYCGSSYQMVEQPKW